jgi:hypothetical protein
LTRSWVLDWRGCFKQEMMWDAPSSFGLWAWPLEASHSAHPEPLVPTFSPCLWTLDKVWRGLLT